MQSELQASRAGPPDATKSSPTSISAIPHIGLLVPSCMLWVTGNSLPVQAVFPGSALAPCKLLSHSVDQLQLSLPAPFTHSYCAPWTISWPIRPSPHRGHEHWETAFLSQALVHRRELQASCFPDPDLRARTACWLTSGHSAGSESISVDDFGATALT